MKPVDWLKYWLPVLAWAGLIFYLSGIPHLAVASGWADYWTRKPAHMFVYCVLWLLIYRAALFTAYRDSRWRVDWRLVGWSLVAVLVYAASDELHQHFVRGRTGKVSDLAWDMGGALVGVGAAYWWEWWGRVTRDEPQP